MINDTVLKVYLRQKRRHAREEMKYNSVTGGSIFWFGYLTAVEDALEWIVGRSIEEEERKEL